MLETLQLAEEQWLSIEEEAKQKTAATQNGDSKGRALAAGSADSVAPLADNMGRRLDIPSEDFAEQAVSASEEQHGEVSSPKDLCANGVWRWTSVESLVVYGLGSMEARYGPRYQLAFTLLLAEQLPSLRGPVEAFDPVFSEVDCMLLRHLGIKVGLSSPSGE